MFSLRKSIFQNKSFYVLLLAEIKFMTVLLWHLGFPFHFYLLLSDFTESAEIAAVKSEQRV